MGGGKGKRELFSQCRVLVLQDEKVLEIVYNNVNILNTTNLCP